jgi:hypothetical protein
MMYDNVDFRLRNTDVFNLDFLSETPQYLDRVTGEHNFNGEYIISGILGNTLNNNYYKITVSNRDVNIKNGSLCKYHLGDNFKTMTMSSTRTAIERLSDTLHLPIEKATVTRLDIAQNFIVKNPVQDYYNHLGELSNSKRSPITNGTGNIEGVYYFKRLGLLLFYNKLKEQRDKGQPIPEIYQDRNVLRYEQRYQKNLAKSFNVERVTAAMLFDEAFYINVTNLWKENYFNIKKINDISLNFDAMKGKTDLYNMGVLALVERQGGELNLISQVQEAYRSGKLSKKQAFDIKQAITAACKIKDGITAQNEAIMELDKKVIEAVQYYR